MQIFGLFELLIFRKDSLLDLTAFFVALFFQQYTGGDPKHDRVSVSRLVTR